MYLCVLFDDIIIQCCSPKGNTTKQLEEGRLGEKTLSREKPIHKRTQSLHWLGRRGRGRGTPLRGGQAEEGLAGVVQLHQLPVLLDLRLDEPDLGVVVLRRSAVDFGPRPLLLWGCSWFC